MSVTRGSLKGLIGARSILRQHGRQLWLYVWANFHADVPPPLSAYVPLGRRCCCSRRAAAAVFSGRRPRRSCLPDELYARASRSLEQEAVRGGARAVPQDRRASSQLDLRPARAVPDRRGVLPRGGVRQGHQGVRDLPGLLPPPPDRRPRPVPAGHELLRPDEAGRAGPGYHRARRSISSRSSSRSTPTAATPPTRSPRSTSAAGRLAQKELWVADLLLQPGQSRARPASGWSTCSRNTRAPW